MSNQNAKRETVTKTMEEIVTPTNGQTDLYQRIQEIKKYYHEVDREILSKKGKHIFNTGGDGAYAANTIDTFVDIIVNGIMDQRQTSNMDSLRNLKFLDAGCGDSRSLAIASLFGLGPYGIDVDKYLVEEISRKASRELHQRGTIPSQFKVERGDFTKNEPYERLGISLKDLDYVVHSINSVAVFDLIKKFAKEAKQGAGLILLGGPGVVLYKEDALKHGLSMSKLYRVNGETGIQNSYVFLTKHLSFSP